ncbi:MAG: hypothetical protein ABH808_02640 [Candidatus Kuenenbacteria bacterium]
MYNWSVDTTELKKDKKKYTIWKLEQMVNFGLGKDKIDRKELKKYWPFLNLDEKRKKFLSMLLWPKRF